MTAALIARSTMPKPRIGSGLAVHETTMSNCDKRSPMSSSLIAVPPRRLARTRPRSTVRLAMTTCFGRCAEKCVAHSSIISPAPMKRIF
jgi:hypothetical protein